MAELRERAAEKSAEVAELSTEVTKLFPPHLKILEEGLKKTLAYYQ